MAIAGNVEKIKALNCLCFWVFNIEAEDIDLSRSTRSLGNSRRTLTKKRINKGGFSHIGSPNEGDAIDEGMLIEPCLKLLDSIDSHQELSFSFLDFHGFLRCGAFLSCDLNRKDASQSLKKGIPMFHRKLIQQQIQETGVRLGDSCSIFPSHGKKKAFTLNRHCIDLISSHYRPQNLSMSYIELPHFDPEHFHYRLELDETTPAVGRFVLKTIKGRAFWLNGLAAKEAYVERSDRLYIEDHKFNFDPYDLGTLSREHFDHPVLKMRQLLESDLKILVMGETGTGKTYLAKKIHEKSGKRGSFVGINLSSFNPMLIESELFGHKKGAFTGAISDKMGALALSENGTLFLDEVDSLPLDVQTKLLTFLDNRKYRRVGEAREQEVRARLIFASGRNLETLVEQGLFRKDFYYRLKSGHSVELKALRNDVKKIRDTCQQFSLNQGISLSLRLIEFYESLAWPGNIRQLLGHLEKKKVLSRGTKIDFDHLDEELLLQSSDLMSLPGHEEIVSMKQCKIDHAKKVLSVCAGNVSLTARKLQLTEKTVRSLLHEVS